jgi:hypothetical protein
MKTTNLFLVMTALSTATLPAQTANFDTAEIGKTPPGWTVAITGKGEPNWTVEQDETAPSKPAALKQSGIVPGPSYPLCIKDAPVFRDGFAEVKFKSVSGKGDQAAGIIWRCVDKDNYYICRANALEDNVVLYKVEKGKRTALDIVGRQGGYGVAAPVAKAQWHTLRVTFAGNAFAVVLDGRKLFDVQDETFQVAGKVGLWTKADSVMLFDDFAFGPK